MEPGVSHKLHPQILILFFFQYMCLYVVFWGVHMCYNSQIWRVRGQLVGIDSILLLCVSWDLLQDTRLGTGSTFPYLSHFEGCPRPDCFQSIVHVAWLGRDGAL